MNPNKEYEPEERDLDNFDAVEALTRPSRQDEIWQSFNI